MKNLLIRWSRKYFSDPQAIILAILLLLGFTVIYFMGDVLAPVLASMVIAYLLEGMIRHLERHKVPRFPAVLLVFVPFMGFLLFLLLGLLPLLSEQVTQLVHQLPDMISRGQQALLRLPDLYPNYISESQVRDFMASMHSAVGRLGQNVLSFSLASISGLFMWVIYLILVPVLVFFALKDKKIILGWVANCLPRDRALAARVWDEMDQQIGNYIRGKFFEILIVGVVCYLLFGFMGLNFAMLLAALVGLSVIIPFIGAAAVTIPVTLIAYFQWGWGTEFAYLMIAYGVIQALDGNLLVPWLFSEVVNLHPIAIIIAVLVFGEIWGVWGVFFAIPLATLIKAVLNAWPRSEGVEVTADLQHNAT